MKKSLIALVAVALMAVPARADTIGGVDIEIPEGWEFAMEDNDEEAGTWMNVYVSGSESLIIHVTDTSSVSEDMRVVYDVLTWDCKKIAGEYEGYTLMYDMQDNTVGYRKLFQECIFYDGEDWRHLLVGSGNLDGYVIGIVYRAPSISPQTHILDCVSLIDNVLFEKQSKE